MHGNAKQTGGGLKKKDLIYNKNGKVVSKKMSMVATKKFRLQSGGNKSKKQSGGSGGGKKCSEICHIRSGRKTLLRSSRQCTSNTEMIDCKKYRESIHESTRELSKLSVHIMLLYAVIIGDIGRVSVLKDDSNIDKVYTVYDYTSSNDDCIEKGIGAAKGAAPTMEATPITTDTMKGLLDHTPLMIAVMNGNIGMAQYLLDIGADINYTTTSAELSPLTYACMDENKKMAQFLVEKGADKDKLKTALDAAIESGEMVKVDRDLAVKTRSFLTTLSPQN
jgi:hypothetical protein